MTRSLICLCISLHVNAYEEVAYHVEACLLIYFASQWIGFYILGAAVMEKLKKVIKY